MGGWRECVAFWGPNAGGFSRARYDCLEIIPRIRDSDGRDLSPCMGVHISRCECGPEKREGKVILIILNYVPSNKLPSRGRPAPLLSSLACGCVFGFNSFSVCKKPCLYLYLNNSVHFLLNLMASGLERGKCGGGVEIPKALDNRPQLLPCETL